MLDASAPSFSHEYASHRALQTCWFLMAVTPLVGAVRNGAVVMHLDITAQKRGEASLRRFAGTMDAIADAVYLVDRASMAFIHVNEAACRMQHQSREPLLTLGPAALLGIPRVKLERTYDAIIASGEPAEPLVLAWPRADHAPMWVEVRRQAQRSGELWTIVTLIRDITERKESTDRIAYLNRVYAMLSGINTLIVRVSERDELFTQACRIAVQEGGFRMA